MSISSEDDWVDDDDDVFMYYLLYYYRTFPRTDSFESFVHSRNKKLFFNSLSKARRILRRRVIPRPSLVSNNVSPFRTIFLSAIDHSLVTTTGFTYDVFCELLRRFTPVFEAFTPFDYGNKIRKLVKRTRPKTIQPVDCLGLQLFYLRNRGPQWVMCTVFGMTQTAVSLHLRFSRRVLIKLLGQDQSARARSPNSVEIEQFIESISNRHPILGSKRVWGTMDGLKLTLQQSGRFTIQLRYYNGWTHDHYISNLFVFAPDGTIRFYCINCPRSVHDSQVGELSGMFQKLQSVFDKFSATLTVDSVFSSSRYPFLIKSSESALATTEEDFC